MGLVRRMLALTLVVALSFLFLAGCSGGSSNTPTTPTPAPTPTPTPTPTPAPQTFTLSGTITGLGAVPLESATVEILDGDQAGTRAETNAQGVYQVTGLTGNMNGEAAESCHLSQRAGKSLTQNQVLDFRLDPLPVGRPRQLSPPDGTVFNHFPRTTTVSWSGVACAVSYVIEIQFFVSGGSWVQHAPIRTTESTSDTFTFVGAQPGRWRVWSVDRYGREGAKTDWWEFRYTV